LTPIEKNSACFININHLIVDSLTWLVALHGWLAYMVGSLTLHGW